MRSTLPPPTRPAYPADHIAARATHRFAHVNGLRLHTLDYGGEGAPIVLLHGVGGNAWMWLGVAPHLTETGRTIAVDFRGYGDSQWSPEQDYTTEAFASDVEGMLDALALPQVDVVGFSWGGLVGLTLAARSPRVRRLAIVDVPPSFEQSDTDIVPLSYTFSDENAAVQAEGRLSPRGDDDLVEAVAALAVRPSEGGHLVKKHDSYFLLRWPFRNDELWNDLRSLKQPTLVVRAAESPVLPQEVARRMVSELHDGRLAEIEGCGHLIPVERPGELAGILQEFLG